MTPSNDAPPRLVEPPEQVVEGSILEHDHDDMVERIPAVWSGHVSHLSSAQQAQSPKTNDAHSTMILTLQAEPATPIVGTRRTQQRESRCLLTRNRRPVWGCNGSDRIVCVPLVFLFPADRPADPVVTRQDGTLSGAPDQPESPSGDDGDPRGATDRCPHPQRAADRRTAVADGHRRRQRGNSAGTSPRRLPGSPKACLPNSADSFPRCIDLGDPGRIDRQRRWLRVTTLLMFGIITLVTATAAVRLVIGILTDARFTAASQLLSSVGASG